MINSLINNENLFLVVLGLVWIVGAVVQDLRRREVDNLWNFSLIVFALAYRASVSIFNGNYWFALNGLIGLVIFFGLGNLFYYSRLFAGGDAKLLMALGAVLPLSYHWLINLKIFGYFILLFLVVGSVYALIYAVCLISRNFKKFSKEFGRQYALHKKMFFIALVFALLWVVFSFFINQPGFVLIGLVILLFPVLFIFAKAVEESCMIKKVKPSEVTEGDWLYRDIVVGGKKIRSNWEGVSKRKLKLIRKSRKKILIKQGIPFTPSFLFGFLGLLYLMWRVGWLF